MPQARPAKRPSDADDAVAAADGASGPKLKLPRLERGAEDFSSVVKSKLQSYTRTGQACDRCKVRKIRCDALPEGCSHCASQNLDCYVTDRVTGRTERRGYLQQLEREKSAMLAHIRELEKLLQNDGVQVKPWQWPNYNTSFAPGATSDAAGTEVHDPTSKEPWQKIGSLWVRGGQKRPQQQRPQYTRYSLIEPRPAEGHLGVTADNAPLSSIKGTTLSVLGTTIDITSFDAPDMDEPPAGTPIGSPLYNKSVMAFLQSVLNVNPPQGNVELPSRQDAFTYAEWYFLMLSPFLPILHKPSFLQLLTRIYDEPTFKASTSELVLVHMVFATIYFQYGIRNREEPEKHAQLNDLSNKHYHWSLSKFFDLAISQTVTAVQALAMIVSHTRNFAKPGASSTIANFAFMKAIELNFHRAVKIPGGGTTLENEIRKRSWWAILAVLCTLNGRLGRPMPISVEEFDVEFPVAIDDEYLGEDGILDPSKIGHCSYQCGLMAFKVTPLYMEMYSKIYGIRRDPSKYIDVVHELEAGMRELLDNLPSELREDECKPGMQVFGLYTQAFCLEFSLCLRHPSVCLTDDERFRAENSRICEETAKKLLKVVGSLHKLKSLDTTWYQLAVYVAAIFTMLVAHWERRFDTSVYELATLREDMTLWLSIITEIGRSLSTGTRLATEVGAIIERTISWIEQDMRAKPGSGLSQAPVKQESSPPFQQQPGQPVAGSKQYQLTGNNAPSTPTSGTGTPNDQPQRPTTAAVATNGAGYYEGASATPYPPLNYTDQPSAGAQQANGTGLTSNPAYDSADGAQYLYAAAAAVTASAAAAAANARETQETNPLVTFASQAAQHVAAAGQQQVAGSGAGGEGWRTTQAQAQQYHAHHQHLQHAHVGAASPWHDWTAAIADSQERYSANALLTLGSSGVRPGEVPVEHQHRVAGHGHQQSAGDGMVGVGVGVNQLGVVAASPTGQWPLLLFNDGMGTGNGQ